MLDALEELRADGLGAPATPSTSASEPGSVTPFSTTVVGSASTARRSTYSIFQSALPSTAAVRPRKRLTERPRVSIDQPATRAGSNGSPFAPVSERAWTTFHMGAGSAPPSLGAVVPAWNVHTAALPVQACQPPLTSNQYGRFAAIGTAAVMRSPRKQAATCAMSPPQLCPVANTRFVSTQ